MTHEEWREVPGHPGYEVSSLGQVRSPRTILKPWASNDLGHLKVSLTGRRRMYVHRIVALAFFGECPTGLEVRHLNGKPGDNRVGNLAYGTRAENLADRVLHGTVPGPRLVCKRGHAKKPGKCLICAEVTKKAWVAKNVGVYAECDDCGRTVSVLNMTTHRRTTCRGERRVA
jgi:hypothetical protein